MTGVPSTAIYDTIGAGYGRYRRADPRIASQILAALADAGRRRHGDVLDRHEIDGGYRLLVGGDSG